MKKCVVIGGSKLDVNLKDYITDDMFIIAADKGWEHCILNGVTPDLVIGDFDSSKKPENIKTITLPIEKDDTDTFFIARYIIENLFTDVLFLALSGGNRFEHTMANIQTMNFLSKNNVNTVMIDKFSKMFVVNSNKVVLEKEEDSYFSLIALGVCEEVSVKGAKYETENLKLTDDYPIAISNEFKNDNAEISLTKGSLLVIITKKD